MRRILLLVVLLFTFAMAKAQDLVTKKPKDTVKGKLDTLDNEPKYINQGKIAGKKAFHRSLMFPGLGQIYNYGLVVDDVKSGRVEGTKFWQKTYIIAKLGAIYGGGTALVISYMDNNKLYQRFLKELQYRQLHNNKPLDGNGLERYTDIAGLTTAKNIYKRNREIVLISLVGLYGLSAVDAYVTARLKYFNVEESLAFKLTPSVINSGGLYGFNSPAPAIKLIIKL